MTRELRCPMRECRRRIDLDALPPRAYAERDACMHFVAAWGGSRDSMLRETLQALEDNREFIIRNIRSVDLPDAALEVARPEIEAAVERYAHVVGVDGARASESGALFGDEFERNGLGRVLARLILGVDPIAGQLPERTSR